MTKIEIANIALDQLGMDPVNDILTPTTDVSRRIKRLYEVAAFYVLTYHAFRKSITFKTVVDEATTEYTSHNTLNAAGASSFVTTSAIGAETPYTGTLKITYSGVLFDEADYASWSGSTFTLDTGVTLIRAYDNGDTLAITPNNHDVEWERMYDIPSDSLKVLDLNNDKDTPFIVEGVYIFTNEYDATNGVVIRYTKDIRDEVSSVVVFSDQVGEAIAARIAYLMAPFKERLARRTFFEDILHDAIGSDAEESVYEGDGARKLWSETV